MASAQGLDEVMAEARARGWEPAPVWAPVLVLGLVPAPDLDRAPVLALERLLRATVKVLALTWAGPVARVGGGGLAAVEAGDLDLAWDRVSDPAVE